MQLEAKNVVSGIHNVSGDGIATLDGLELVTCCFAFNVEKKKSRKLSKDGSEYVDVSLSK